MFITDWVKEFLAGTICSCFSNVYQNVSGFVTFIGGDIAASPSSWQPSIWSMIEQVAQTVIIPIAALVLTAVMCLELVHIMQDKNNMRSGGEVVGQLFTFICKIGLGAVLVQRAPELTLAIFDVGAFVTDRAIGVVTSTPNIGGAMSQAAMEAMRQQLVLLEIGELGALLVFVLITVVITFIMGIVIQLVVMGRLIEIYIYCAMGSLPYATLMNREISSLGQNYIKNLLALAFQGFFILIMVGIYSRLLTSQSLLWEPTISGMTQILVINGALCWMLFRSKSIAKSIFGAQ